MRLPSRMVDIPAAWPSNRQDAMASASAVAGLRLPAALFPLRTLVRGGLLVSVVLMGCDTSPKRKPSPPQASNAPYPALIAVAPFTNESGVPISSSEILQVGDGVVANVNQVRGWNAVPLNRTIQKMRQLGISQIPDLQTAASLVRAMEVDAIILGTITAWDPYDPPQVGVSVILVAEEGMALRNSNPRAFEHSTGDEIRGPRAPAGQIAQMVGMYDATQHATLLRLRKYAAGRYDLTGGFDPPERYYLMVFRRYLEFATWSLVEGLLEQERLRLIEERKQKYAQK